MKKKLLALFVVLALAVCMLASCGGCKTHADDNGDDKCDKCGAEMKENDTPDTPDNPDTPENPDNPDNPDNPAPGVPDVVIDPSKITEAEWRAAFNFTNVTVSFTQQYVSGGIANSSTVLYRIVGGNLYGFSDGEWAEAPAQSKGNFTYLYDFTESFGEFTYEDGAFKADEIALDLTDVEKPSPDYSMIATDIVITLNSSGKVVSVAYDAEMSYGSQSTTASMLIELYNHGTTNAPDVDGGGDDPADPSGPSNPGEPSQPSQPDKPVEPSQPDKPVEPEISGDEVDELAWRDAFDIDNFTLCVTQKYIDSGMGGSFDIEYRLVGDYLYACFDGEWSKIPAGQIASINCALGLSENYSEFTYVDGVYIAGQIALNLGESGAPEGYSAVAMNVKVIISDGKLAFVEFDIAMVDGGGMYAPGGMHMRYFFYDHGVTVAPDVNTEGGGESSGPEDVPEGEAVTESAWREAFKLENVTVGHVDYVDDYEIYTEWLYFVDGRVYVEIDEYCYETDIEHVVYMFDFSNDFLAFTYENGSYYAKELTFEFADGAVAVLSDVYVLFEGEKLYYVIYDYYVTEDGENYYGSMEFMFFDYGVTVAPDLNAEPSEPDDEPEVPEKPEIAGSMVSAQQWKDAFAFENVTIYTYEVYTSFEDDAYATHFYIIDGAWYTDLFGGGVINLDEFDFSSLGIDYDVKQLFVDTVSFAEYYDSFVYSNGDYICSFIDKSSDMVMKFYNVTVTFDENGRVVFISYDGEDGEDTFSMVASFTDYGTTNLPAPPEVGVATYDKGVITFDYPDSFEHDSLEYVNTADSGMSMFSVEHMVTDSFDAKAYADAIKAEFESMGIEDVESSYKLTSNEYTDIFWIEHNMTIMGLNAHLVNLVVKSSETTYSVVACVTYGGVSDTFIDDIFNSIRPAD